MTTTIDLRDYRQRAALQIYMVFSRAAIRQEVTADRIESIKKSSAQLARLWPDDVISIDL